MKRRELLKHLGMTAGALFSANAANPYAVAGADDATSNDLLHPIRGLVRRHGALFQPIEIHLRPPEYALPMVIKVDGNVIDASLITRSAASLQALVSPADTVRQVTVSVEVNGATRTEQTTVKPVRRVQIYILPHSHHDLGYTDLQANVVERQMRNITLGIELARKTAAYPEGSRFVWNLEVLWGADYFMRRQPKAEQEKLIEAIRKGWVAPNGSYANELTGLCRSDELLELFRYGTQLAKQTGIKIDSAMMSDVPGYSWGTVNAMSQAGIRYFSAAPNYFDRIGTFMVTWQDKPFWWVSPSGKEKVLFWVPWTGYAMSHIMKLNADWVGRYQDRLDEVTYPYKISHIRWSGHGDNAEPDPEICEFTRSWNDTYEWPKFMIASTSTAFSAMEERYGSQLPSFRGDLTPYWEDGAGSSAAETAESRNAADRLTQAAVLTSMTSPASFDQPAFAEAWRDVLLYSEHTWGAWCSVSDSESPFTLEQWDFKKEFATQATQRSQQMLSSLLTDGSSPGQPPSILIHNCNSWDRSEVIYLPRELTNTGDHVSDSHGHSVPSQRLSTGELAVFVTEVPAFGSARYSISAKPAHLVGKPVSIHDGVLQNGLLRARLDVKTGDISELTLQGIASNFVDREKGALNRYVYMQGKDVVHVESSGPASIYVEDHGPLVASVRVESSAPGSTSLVRRVRLTAVTDYLEITNIIDKKQAPLNPNPGKGGTADSFAQSGSKESVQFAFPFAVAQGKMIMDVPLAVMQPERDQLPGSCKNWLPVSRWLDVSNEDHGITWATLDAPLVELGGITATMLSSQRDPSVWRQHIEPTQVVYSWVMNNHWGTNYRAYQTGPVAFRYALRPHRSADLAAAHRFSVGLSQPLLFSRSHGQQSAAASLLRVEPADVVVLGLKPSDDGKAWIVRLYEASGRAQSATLVWLESKAGSTWLSNLAEESLKPITGNIEIAAFDLMSLRVQRL